METYYVPQSTKVDKQEYGYTRNKEEKTLGYIFCPKSLIPPFSYVYTGFYAENIFNGEKMANIEEIRNFNQCLVLLPLPCHQGGGGGQALGTRHHDTYYVGGVHQIIHVSVSTAGY